MSKKYRLNVNRVAAVPRSERLRKAGGSVASSVAKTIIESKTESGALGDGHTHANLGDLDRFASDTNGYGYLDGEKIKSGYADEAWVLSDDSPTRKEFLSRINPDTAAGRITFQQGLTSEQNAYFDAQAQSTDFLRDMLLGKGWGVDALGNAEFESLRIRSSLTVLELICNRLSALEGDQILTESDTITGLQYLAATATYRIDEDTTKQVSYSVNSEGEMADSEGAVLDESDKSIEKIEKTYRLFFKSKYEGYFTAHTRGSILKGIFNNLPKVAADGSTTGASYFTSWMRVDSVNAQANSAVVTLYPDDQVPSGINYAPCELMVVARMGHQTDEERQSYIYLSSTEQRMLITMGVMSPTTEFSNIGCSIGKLPTPLLNWARENVNSSLPDTPEYGWFRRLFAVGGVITVDKEGKVIGQQLTMGDWYERCNPPCNRWISEDDRFYNAVTAEWISEKCITGVYTHYGCQWLCCKDGTEDEPRYDSTDWAFLSGNPDFTLEFEETDYNVSADGPTLTLHIVAKYHNRVITELCDVGNLEFTRQSWDVNGDEQVASDLQWSLKFAAEGRIGWTIELQGFDDFNIVNGNTPSKLTYTATLEILDGSIAAAATIELK